MRSITGTIPCGYTCDFTPVLSLRVPAADGEGAGTRIADGAGTDSGLRSNNECTTESGESLPSGSDSDDSATTNTNHTATTAATGTTNTTGGTDDSFTSKCPLGQLPRNKKKLKSHLCNENEVTNLLMSNCGCGKYCYHAFRLGCGTNSAAIETALEIRHRRFEADDPKMLMRQPADRRLPRVRAAYQEAFLRLGSPFAGP